MVAQQRLSNPMYDLHISQDYKSAQRQYDLGLSQNTIAKKWGIATLSLSGLSLLGYAVNSKNSESNLFSFWVPVASIGTAAVGVCIKLSSIANVGSGQYKMEQINTGNFEYIGRIELGVTQNGVGLSYNF